MSDFKMRGFVPWLTAFWLAIVLFLPSTFAMKVFNTGIAGEDLSLYGSSMAFVSEGKIHLYDISKQAVIPLNLSGAGPCLFAYTLVFETNEGVIGKDLNSDNDLKDSVINVFDIHKNSTIALELGNNPAVYAKTVAFSTKEADLGVDFNNDGDVSDEIIRVLNLDTRELSIIRITGSNPVVAKDFAAFESEGVIKTYDLMTKKVDITHVQGTSLAVEPKHGVIAFVSKDGQTEYYYYGNKSVVETGFAGANPSISKTTIAFSYENRLYFYNILKQKLVTTEIFGEKPSLFDDTVAFVTQERFVGDLNGDGDSGDVVLRYAMAEDNDRDGLDDFNDNCPLASNEDQTDSDNDGKGDACDEKENKIVPVKITPKTKENETKPEVEAKPEKPVAWKWWAILAIIFVVLAIIAYFYLPRYIRKKRKGFGF